MHNVIAIDIMPDGRAVPVAQADLPDWSQPPEGFSRAMRRRFKHLFRHNRSEYRMPADLAHYHAARKILRERRLAS